MIDEAQAVAERADPQQALAIFVHRVGVPQRRLALVGRGQQTARTIRAEFPTVESTLHFISHSLGAMPRGVEEAMRRYTHTWKARGIRAWEESWFALPTEVGNLLAGILDAEPGSITMFENCTNAHNVALSAVDFTKPRDRLVISHWTVRPRLPMT